MKTNCLIVDDEMHARRLLADYLKKMPDLTLVAECKNAMEAMQVLRSQPIDLVLLDIQMPDLTGIELLRTLQKKPAVIFTTAYKDYALQGYELDVVDYLLKPITFERFVRAINKAVAYNKAKNNPESQDAMMMSQGKSAPGTINLKADYKIYRVNLDDILYIEGLKEYVTFYTRERKYIVLESLRHLMEILPADKFMRVHKSYIIHTHRITAMYGNVLEIGKIEIPIGKSYADEVKASIFSAQY